MFNSHPPINAPANDSTRSPLRTCSTLRNTTPSLDSPYSSHPDPDTLPRTSSDPPPSHICRASFFILIPPGLPGLPFHLSPFPRFRYRTHFAPSTICLRHAYSPDPPPPPSLFPDNPSLRDHKTHTSNPHWPRLARRARLPMGASPRGSYRSSRGRTGWTRWMRGSWRWDVLGHGRSCWGRFLDRRGSVSVELIGTGTGIFGVGQRCEMWG
jgi:hypothetical protein